MPWVSLLPFTLCRDNPSQIPSGTVLLSVCPPKHSLTACLLLLHAERWPPKTDEPSRQTFPAADGWARVLGRHGDVWQCCPSPKWTRTDKRWRGKGCAHQKVTHSGLRRNIHLQWTSSSIYCETSSPIEVRQCLQLMVEKYPFPVLPLMPGICLN